MSSSAFADRLAGLAVVTGAAFTAVCTSLPRCSAGHFGGSALSLVAGAGCVAGALCPDVDIVDRATAGFWGGVMLCIAFHLYRFPPAHLTVGIYRRISQEDDEKSS